MEKMTKKAWIEKISGEVIALMGAPWGYDFSIDWIAEKTNAIPENGIKYTENGALVAGRKVEKVRSKDIVFRVIQTGENSYLQTTGGEYYSHSCKSGEYMIAFFPRDSEEGRSHAVVYVVSKTGK